jgi:hypothetical protein
MLVNELRCFLFTGSLHTGTSLKTGKISAGLMRLCSPAHQVHSTMTTRVGTFTAKRPGTAESRVETTDTQIILIAACAFMHQEVPL